MARGPKPEGLSPSCVRLMYDGARQAGGRGDAFDWRDGVTHNRRRKDYGRPKLDQVKRLKKL